jgi:hypothetical protein
MHIRGRNYWMLGAALVAASCGGDPPGPAIATIAPVTVNQDTTARVPLTITDSQAALSSLVITASADNGNLVAPQGLSVQNTDSGPVLNVTPLEAATGSTAINVMVTDPGGGMVQGTFMLTVNAVNVSFSAFAAQVLAAADSDSPLAVNGKTFIQDADSSTQFNNLFN